MSVEIGFIDLVELFHQMVVVVLYIDAAEIRPTGSFAESEFFGLFPKMVIDLPEFFPARAEEFQGCEDAEVLQVRGLDYILQRAQRIPVSKLQVPAALQPRHFFDKLVVVIIGPVHRKDIDPESAVILFGEGQLRFHTSLLILVNPTEIQIVVRIGFANDLISVGSIGFAEALVVLAGHKNVDVVIPGNKALMTDGPDQRAIGQRVLDPILFAELVDVFQDVQAQLLNLLGRQFFHFSAFKTKGCVERPLQGIGTGPTPALSIWCHPIWPSSPC